MISSGEGTCPRCSFCPGKSLTKSQYKTGLTHPEGSTCCQDGDCKCGIKKTARIVGGQETQVRIVGGQETQVRIVRVRRLR